MSQALYRKYRSKSLSEIVGQDHVTNILTRSLAQGKVAHAYLLTGPRGVGKTSIARILAHEINNLVYDETTAHLDIIEIDAASNNGVDDVRDLREKAQITPVSASKKVYIIDEVHMLSKQAFNALLKTLEEPPAHIVFILATTDAHKVPDTIISRTQRFTFRSITQADALKHLRMIADSESIQIEDEALALVAEHGDGSFRDSISLLDQLSILAEPKTPITLSLVEQVMGLAPRSTITALLQAHTDRNQAAVIALLDGFEQMGIEAHIITNQLIRTLKPQLSDDPKAIKLLDSLIDVLRSPRPDVKLLTALLAGSVSSRKSAPATVAAPPELRILEKEATTLHPSERRIEKAITAYESPEIEPIGKPVKKRAKSLSTAEFDWDNYLTHMKKDQLALYSILTKCKYELEGDTIRIYTGTAFWKKKLDDAKYQPLLYQGLSEVGVEDLTIETIPTSPPLKDSQAAAVAAIMGGGEEVSLSDSE